MILEKKFLNENFQFLNFYVTEFLKWRALNWLVSKLPPRTAILLHSTVFVQLLVLTGL